MKILTTMGEHSCKLTELYTKEPEAVKTDLKSICWPSQRWP